MTKFFCFLYAIPDVVWSGLIASPKTALLVNKLVAVYTELILKLLTNLIPIQKARTDISICDDHYNRKTAEVARILSEITRFNESAQTNNAVFEALNRSLQFNQNQADKLANERSEHWNCFIQLSIQFNKSLLAEMKQIGEQQIPVLIEIRRDLGLTGDLAEFQLQMQEQWRRMSNQLDQLLNALQQPDMANQP